MDEPNEKQPTELQKPDGAADEADVAMDAGETMPTPSETELAADAPAGEVTEADQPDAPADVAAVAEETPEVDDGPVELDATAPEPAEGEEASTPEEDVEEPVGDVLVDDAPSAEADEPTADDEAPPAEADEPLADDEAPSDETDAPPAEADAAEATDLDEMTPPEGVSMMELLMEEGDFLPEKYRRGDLVEGVVLRKDKDQIILDIGAKQEGVVPSSDLARLPREVIDEIEVGETIQTVVIRPEGREGEVLVSINQARTLLDWDNATECLESGEIMELEIVGYNKGGALVGFGNLQGFVPRSHLVRLAGPRGGDDVSEGLAALVGESVPVKVIEVSRRKRRLIMSERLALREWRSERKQRLLEQLREGEIRQGRVSSIADFGAFVDLGGADGLVHVSELTYERGKHPRDVVTVGQEVEVYVLNIDRDRKRIGLSMKRLQSDPWETVEEDHYVGELVEANISNLAKFGAFARLEDGLEGLIHISELSDEHIEHPREAVRPGQRVTVEIISIEPHRQRIGLSIRRVPRHLRTIDELPEELPEEADEQDVESDEAPEEVTAIEAEAETESEVDGAGEDAVEPEADSEVEDEAEPEAEAASEDADDEADEVADEAADDAEEAADAADEDADEADAADALDPDESDDDSDESDDDSDESDDDSDESDDDSDESDDDSDESDDDSDEGDDDSDESDDDSDESDDDSDGEQATSEDTTDEA